MPSHKSLVSVLGCTLAICLFMGTAGCRRAGPASTPLTGKPGPSGTLHLEKREGKVIYTRADTHWASWDGQLALAVVLDFAGSDRRGNATSGGTFRWQSISADGKRKVDVDWQSTDGKSGSVTINGQKYDLSAGGLFLVTTKDGKLKVEQLQRDFKGDENSLFEMALKDEQLKRFVAEAMEP